MLTALSPRLAAIAGMVPDRCRCLADIGTDHGYLPVWLLLHDRAGTAIAADIAPGPLDRARRTAASHELAERIDLRLGDGLTVLAPGEADTIVIAGMGGDNIAAILAAAPWTRAGPVLLLQPMSRAEVLRRWLPENGYAVRAERLVLDKGILYPILSVSGGAMPPASEAQAWGGFLLEEDPLWEDYLAQQTARLRRAADGLSQAKDPALAGKREALLSAAAEMERRAGDAHSKRSRTGP